MRKLLVIAVLLVVAGCGSSGADKTAQSQTTATTSSVQSTSTGSTPASGADGPKGRLNAAEYSQMASAYAILKKIDILDPGKDIAKAIRVGRPACSKMTATTALLQAVHADCQQTFRFLATAQQLVTKRAECTKAAQAGDISCFANLFRALGRSARVELVRADAVNRELRRRRINGDCFDSLGTLPKERAASQAVVHDALGAAQALERRNQDAFVRAASRLSGHLNDVGGGTAAQSVRQLKACRG